MKITIQKTTGIDEVVVVEITQADPRRDFQDAIDLIDERLMQTNQKIVEAREFIQQVKDPWYKYQFTAFLDNFLGISSQAESLLRKFNLQPVEPPQEPPAQAPPKMGKRESVR
mgnify:FL=1